MSLHFFILLNMVFAIGVLTNVKVIECSLVSAGGYKQPICGITNAREGRLNCSVQKWEKVVPYKLSQVMADRLREAIGDAITTWNRIFENCIEFTPHKTESDFVTFIEGLMCFSFVGRKPGGQAISLHSFTCGGFGKIAHEMMHTIGFFHEQSRPDRDKYIKLNHENIPFDWENDFRLVNETSHFSRVGPYDYYSVMHYPVLSPDGINNAFDVLKKGIDEDRIGLQLNFTELDIKKIKMMYCSDKLQDGIPSDGMNKLLRGRHIPGEGYLRDMDYPAYTGDNQ